MALHPRDRGEDCIETNRVRSNQRFQLACIVEPLGFTARQSSLVGPQFDRNADEEADEAGDEVAHLRLVGDDDAVCITAIAEAARPEQLRRQPAFTIVTQRRRGEQKARSLVAHLERAFVQARPAVAKQRLDWTPTIGWVDRDPVPALHQFHDKAVLTDPGDTGGVRLDLINGDPILFCSVTRTLDRPAEAGRALRINLSRLLEQPRLLLQRLEFTTRIEKGELIAVSLAAARAPTRRHE